MALIRRTKVEVRVGKFKNAKASAKNEPTGEMIKGIGDRVVDWVWRLCNMSFESGVVSEVWRSDEIVPLYKGICKNYRGTSLLSGVEKNICRDLSRQSPLNDWGFD